MKHPGKTIGAVAAAGVLITLSEFVRNELLFKYFWVDHYAVLGMTFPSDPVNGVVWMLWSFVFACVVFAISRKFPFTQTFLLAWVTGFVMMWLVIGNMNVLPFGLLWYAVPLSLLEAGLAVWIVVKITPPDPPVTP